MAAAVASAPPPLPLAPLSPSHSLPAIPASASSSSSSYPSLARDMHHVRRAAAPPLTPPHARADDHIPIENNNNNEAIEPDAAFDPVPPPDAITSAFAALGRFEAQLAALGAQARQSFSDALRAGSTSLRDFERTLPALPAALSLSLDTDSATAPRSAVAAHQKSLRPVATELAPPPSSAYPSAGPFSSLTLPPPPRARPSSGYREHSPGYDYNSTKRRRVDEDAQWRDREADYRDRDRAQYLPPPPPPPHDHAHHHYNHSRNGSGSGSGSYASSKYAHVDAATREQALPHSPVRERHSHHYASDRASYPLPPSSQSYHQGQPRVDARELVRGQKERARRAAAGNVYPDERLVSATPSNYEASGVKRRRSGSDASSFTRYDDQQLRREREADNDDIDAMLLETATDGERERERERETETHRGQRSLPSPLSSASPPAPAPATLKPISNALSPHPTTTTTTHSSASRNASASGSVPASLPATASAAAATATANSTSAPVPPEPQAPQKFFPPTNEAGERICRACGAAGRMKDGRCVEKWGPGPLGPGTVCDRCRKKMKRVERRATGVSASGGLVVGPGIGGLGASGSGSLGNGAHGGSVRDGGVVYRKQLPSTTTASSSQLAYGRGSQQHNNNHHHQNQQGIGRQDTLIVDNEDEFDARSSRGGSHSPAVNGYSSLPPRHSTHNQNGNGNGVGNHKHVLGYTNAHTNAQVETLRGQTPPHISALSTREQSVASSGAGAGRRSPAHAGHAGQSSRSVGGRRLTVPGTSKHRNDDRERERERERRGYANSRVSAARSTASDEHEREHEHEDADGEADVDGDADMEADIDEVMEADVDGENENENDNDVDAELEDELVDAADAAVRGGGRKTNGKTNRNGNGSIARGGGGVLDKKAIATLTLGAANRDRDEDGDVDADADADGDDGEGSVGSAFDVA